MPEDPSAPVFAALADPTRRHVLRALASRDHVTASGLASELPISRQAVAKHLAALREAGLAEASSAGRETRYTMVPGPLNDAVGWLSQTGREWDDRLERLQRRG